MVTEDGIEKIIGQFGRYHVQILVLIFFGSLPTEFQLNNVVFVIPTVSYICLDGNALNMTNYCPCENPDYDQSNIVSSVTTEWNLICDRTWMASLAQSMLQVGILIGSLIYGHISDIHGRRIAVLLTLLLQVLFVLISAFVTQYWMFLVCQILIGTSIGGTMLCCYILMMELSGNSFRPYLNGLCELSYISGYMLLPAIAYYVREWRYLQLSTSAPWFIIVVYYWLIPESPRWLITVGRKKEAINLLSQIAKRNKRSVDNIAPIVDKIEEELIKQIKQRKGSYLDLFKTPHIRRNTFITVFIWMFCSFTFFGVKQYIGGIEGNLYLNVMLSAVMLVPGLILTVLANLYIKRRVSIMGSFIIASLALFVIQFVVDQSTITLILAIIGQASAYASFMQTYLFSTEIFPTIIRNSALGFASMFARIGGFVAPFVVNINIERVSFVIFSIVALSAAILCYFLPETKDKVLLNSIEQTELTEKNEQLSTS